MRGRFQEPVGVAVKEHDGRMPGGRGVVPPLQRQPVIGHNGKFDVGMTGITGARCGVIMLGMKDQMALIDVETGQTKAVNRDCRHGDPSENPGEAGHGAAPTNGMIQYPP